ncbi:MAG: tetratricopeptide repeat protein [Bacteroidia bacterium]|nr:tetratricopeptide repeat protein [Bacteroidia bacterium]
MHIILVRNALFSFFILLSGFSFSQKNKIDSLLGRLRTLTEDSFRVDDLNDLGRALAFSNPDSSITLSNQALELSKNLKWKKGMANSYGNLGVYNGIKGNYPQSLDCFLKSLRLVQDGISLDDRKKTASMLGNVGNVYWNQGEFNKALDYFEKALKLDSELKNRAGVAKHLGNIGMVYADLNNYEKALDYYFNYLKMAEELESPEFQSIAFVNIGSAYADLGNYQKALDYFLKSLKISEENGDLSKMATLFGNIGSLYTEQKEFKKAFDFLYKGLIISDSMQALKLVEGRYEELSRLYERSNIPLPDSIGGKLLNTEQMRLRSLYYYKKYISLRDTLFSEENNKQLVRKEMNFEFEKKEAAAKTEQLKNEEVAKAENRKQKIIIISVAGCLLLVIGFAGFIFRALRITRKQKILIEHQKQLVDEKQKEILDSIYYASRIQRALITSEKYITRNLTRLMK